MTGQNVGVTMTTKRGPETWAYIYTALGFVLTIESTIIGMMTPLMFPWNVIVFVALAAITGWAFIESKWVHDKLVKLKTRYENKAR
jgi:hypothetical protein